jgi:hypothetical protein
MDVRQERSNRYVEEQEDWYYSKSYPSLCTFNGRWMFSSKNGSGCIAMLTQQLGHESIMDQRESRYWDLRHENIQNATWLFLRHGAYLKAMDQLFAREDVIEKRKWSYNEQEWEHQEWEIFYNTIQNATWLFLRRGAYTKAMHQLFVRDDIREERREQKEYVFGEMTHWSDWDYWFGCYSSCRKAMKKDTTFGCFLR